MATTINPALLSLNIIKDDKPDISMAGVSHLADEKIGVPDPEAKVSASGADLISLAGNLDAQNFEPPVAQPAEGAFCTRSTFFVNADCTSRDDLEQGQQRVARMFVECLEPLITVHKLPIILIHGDWHTGQVWTTKPDGAPGWGSYFNYQGYRVFIVDLPTCGRSNVLVNGRVNQDEQTAALEPGLVERDMTATAKQANLGWPSARLHTQWPGTGQRGDETFENYCSSLVPIFLRKHERQMLGQKALSELLHYTGRAILVAEGSGATTAWLAADVKPELVAGVVAIEPAGPPAGSSCFVEEGIRRYTSHIRPVPNTRAYGIADIPMTWGPPDAKGKSGAVVAAAGKKHSQLDLVSVSCYSGRGTCIMQRDPEASESAKSNKSGKKKASVAQPRHLVNLKKMPHSVWTGEASSHSMFDWATVQFMRQAGVPIQSVPLEQYGVFGNGRLMFLERNSDSIANLIAGWINIYVNAKEAKVREAAAQSIL